MTTMWTEMLGTETKFYDVNGIRTRVITAGSGPALLLLHGSGGHAEAFSRNIVPLAEHFQVIAMDYLGSGLTDYPDHLPTLKERADHIVGLLDAMGIEKACILGESFGGTQSFAAIKEHPDRFTKLIAVVGGIFAAQADQASFEQFENAMTSMVERQRAFLANPSRETVRQRLAWLFHKPERDITEELVDTRWAFYQRDDVRRALDDLCNMVEFDVQARSSGLKPEERSDTFRPMTSEDLAAITHPTLFIWTDHNPSFSAATAKLAASHVPNADFVVMNDCAHWPQWEKPEEFNRLVTQFMHTPETA
jgi:2-hydroxy-6-oxonona-2,4-dienedioate hydrolase